MSNPFPLGSGSYQAWEVLVRERRISPILGDDAMRDLIETVETVLQEQWEKELDIAKDSIRESIYGEYADQIADLEREVDRLAPAKKVAEAIGVLWDYLQGDRDERHGNAS